MEERADEAAFAWAPKDEIAIRMEKYRTVQEERRQMEAARRVRRRLWGGAIIVLLAAATYAGWYYYARRAQERKVSPPPPEVSVKTEPKADFIDYLLTRTSITFPDGGTYELRRLEFDSNRFLSGHATLDNADKFRSVLASDSFQQEVKDSWVIIFAGASFDGKAEDNHRLCRQRVTAVAAALRATQGLSPKGIWGVAAGEKVLSPQASEEDEENAARKMSSKELSSQRVLIIVAVRGGAPRNGESPQDFIRRLYPHLYRSGLLPTDYDAHEAEPAPIN